MKSVVVFFEKVLVDCVHNLEYLFEIGDWAIEKGCYTITEYI